MDGFDDLGPLAAALAKAQAAYPPIPRDKEVEVQTRTGGKYRFKYAPLDTILNAVRKPLADNGLAVTQLLNGGDLVTMLIHESGASLVARMPLPHSDGTAQALGSAVTYLRRYTLQAMLGIAAEEDDDGKAATADGVTTRPQQRPARPVLAEVVAERLPETRREAPAPATVHEADPEAPVSPGAPETLPDEVGATIAAAATTIFADMAAPGLSMDEMKRMMKERYILPGTVTATAARLGIKGRVADATDADRYRVWEAVLSGAKDEG